MFESFNYEIQALGIWLNTVCFTTLFLQFPKTILLKHTLYWYASHAYRMPKIVISSITNNDIIKLLFIYYYIIYIFVNNVSMFVLA